MPHQLREALRLMLVTDEALLDPRNWVQACLAAERGGVGCIQLRHKTASARELVALARTLVSALTVPLLLNDRLDVALAAEAAGVHLGPDDISPTAARSVVPPGFLIGASVGADEEVRQGLAADYWGVGPYAVTTTKPEAGEPLGPAGFATFVARAQGRPCLAIGGVRPEDGPVVLQHGGVGVAVISGILGSEDIEHATRAYASALGV